MVSTSRRLLGGIMYEVQRYSANDTIRFVSSQSSVETSAKLSRNYPIRIHSMNPIGVENMRRIIKRNHWKEI